MNLENFPTCETAIRMLGTISKGFYDRSYVGKWIFQVMGMEMEDTTRLFEELRQQAFVDTATWGLDYWEQKYGIETNTSLSYERRRQQVKERRNMKLAMNPEYIRQIAEYLSGKDVEIIENIAPYTFRIKVLIKTADSNFNEKRLRMKITDIKPSHLSYEIITERPLISKNYIGAILQDAETLSIRQVI